MITVVGAGPAGLAAALSAANAGESVELIESGARLGGQYWRNLPNSIVVDQQALNHDFQSGKVLREKVQAHPNITVLLNTQVWRASHKEGISTLHTISGGTTREIRTNKLILATGAYDRTLPFPGWDIPGVMTPGGVQALLKGNNVKAGKKIVIAGTGPFLLPVATGLAKYGVDVVGLFEANRLRRWIWQLPALLSNISVIKEGASYLHALRKFKVRVQRGYAVVEAHSGSDGNLSAVTVARVKSDFSVIEGSQRKVACDVAAIGWGFTADLSLAGNLGLMQQVSLLDGGTYVVVDEHQGTSQVGIFAAGEITGIGGSKLSLAEGEIAGSAAAGSETNTSKKRKLAKFASALLRTYPVGPNWQSWLKPETTICRCEEVTLEIIEKSVLDLGATDSRTVKLFTRCGMGMCQGRICGRSVNDVVARISGKPASDADRVSSAARPIASPILLGELAQIPIVD
ncbi:MAG: NAD(P)/FAD-dependent oxidoreductase [Actinomycetes bacterium]